MLILNFNPKMLSFLVEIINNSHELNLFLQDNKISTFKTGTFHSQANPHLYILDLSFNRIKEIPYDTFRFPNLERLLLDDNRISKVLSIVSGRNLYINIFHLDS